VDEDGVVRSQRNPRVQAVVALHDARTRRREGRHIAEGRKVCEEALAAAEVIELFYTEEHADLAARLPVGVRSTCVDERVMVRLSDAVTPQGVVAVVQTPDMERALSPEGSLLVLDRVGDPGNVGTLIRTAAAFGVTVVVTDGSADPFSPKAVRASAGACYRTPVLRRSSVTDHRTELQGSGRRLLGLSADADLTLGQAIAGAGACVLVLGGEPRGLAHATRDALDATVRIPMAVGVESLNVAAAGAIALHAFAGGVR